MIQTWVKLEEIETRNLVLVPLENIAYVETVRVDGKPYARVWLMTGYQITLESDVESLAVEIHRVLTGEEN